MTVQDAARNIASDAVGAAVTALSLHSLDGGSTGANELTGGSYAREVPDYSVAAAAGEDDLATPVVFGGPGVATDAAHLGFWTGTFPGTTWLGSVPLATPKTGFVDPDTLTVTSAPITTT